ncbi:hypothetical protein J6590_068151 [Homalodisca vitripennis]|nr:hypothetical protein J6590_068151 [Homalodisca vitripennis]
MYQVLVAHDRAKNADRRHSRSPWCLGQSNVGLEWWKLTTGKTEDRSVEMDKHFVIEHSCHGPRLKEQRAEWFTGGRAEGRVVYWRGCKGLSGLLAGEQRADWFTGGGVSESRGPIGLLAEVQGAEYITGGRTGGRVVYWRESRGPSSLLVGVRAEGRLVYWRRCKGLSRLLAGEQGAEWFTGGGARGCLDYWRKNRGSNGLLAGEQRAEWFTGGGARG